MTDEHSNPDRRTVLQTVGSLAAVGAVGSTGALAADNATSTEPISSVDIPGTVAEGVVGESGDVAYVAIDQGFVSVDISDPQNPTEMARRTDTGMSEVLDVKEAGDRLIAVGPGNTGSPSGMGYYDVSDPADPELIEWYQTSYTIHNSFLTEDVAYLINNAAADIHLIDVSNDSPSEITSFGIQASILHDIWVQNDILYMCYWDDGTLMVDVSDPANPTEIGYVRDGSSRSPNNDHYVTLNDEGTVLAIGKEQLNYNPLGVELWDVSDKTNTQFLAEIEPPSQGSERTSHNLDIRNGHMYTSWYDAGVLVHDLSDPANPEEVYSWRGDGASFWTAEVAQPGECFIGTDEAVSGGNGRLYTFPDPADDGGGGNEPPTASIDAPGVIGVDETATFDGSGSSDPDGSISSYEWDLGDGSTATGETVEHGYDSTGEYAVELTVTDDGGSSDTASTTVSVQEDPGGDCVDATNWPDGSGDSGYENITSIDVDGQVSESSGTDAYYDFTCPDVVTVQPGGSFEVSMEWDDNGYDGHYANVHVDWEGNQDFSTASETVLMEDAADASTPATATVDVPGDAASGPTLARIRLSYGGFDGPTATGEYGEVNDVTVFVEGDGGGDEGPTAQLDVSPSSPSVDEAVTFDGSGSSDPDGSIDSYEWSVDGEQVATGETAEYTFDSGGDYRVELVVTDDGGNTDSVTETVTVGDDGGGGECVDATNWPEGTGSSGYEYIESIDVDGQVSESSETDAYYDFTCPDVVTVQPGGSFEVSVAWNDNGYDGHYANVHVDWDQNEDFSTASETVLMEDASDASTPATATVDVPGDAPTGSTLARIRLSYGDFDGPTATGEYGEVNDVTISVEE